MFTGVNGLCHRYATTVQCWPVAVPSGSHFIAPFWTKPPAKRAQPYNRPIINVMNTAGHLGSQLLESHSDYFSEHVLKCLKTFLEVKDVRFSVIKRQRDFYNFGSKPVNQ